MTRRYVLTIETEDELPNPVDKDEEDDWADWPEFRTDGTTLNHKTGTIGRWTWREEAVPVRDLDREALGCDPINLSLPNPFPEELMP